MSGLTTHKSQAFRAFTLIELMVVVAIIGVLATIAMPTYKTFVCRSRQSEAKTILAAISVSQEVYRSEYDTYVPGALEDLAELGMSVEGPRSQYVYTVVTPDPLHSSTFTSIATGVQLMTGDVLEGSDKHLIVSTNDLCAGKM